MTSIESLLASDQPLVKEALNLMKGWYKYSTDCALPPNRVTIEWISAERVTLYWKVPPQGTNIPVAIYPFCSMT